MTRIYGILAVLMLVLSACGERAPVEGGEGRPKIYRISQAQAGKIQYNVLDSVNSLRGAAGLPGLQLSSQLNAAAATHSRDMAVQNRPWHFGSDGSSPLDRVARTGYSGELKGENIAETYETELETLAAWMDDPTTRNVVMDASARELGFAWHQEANGKIWWTMVTGGPQ